MAGAQMPCPYTSLWFFSEKASSSKSKRSKQYDTFSQFTKSRECRMTSPGTECMVVPAK